MKHLLTTVAIIFSSLNLQAQGVDADLLAVKARLDSIASYKASMSLDIHAEFIKMPTKYARVSYIKNEPMTFSSDNFVLIPKKGLDFTLAQLFEYPFITVDRGEEKWKDKTYKVLNIIPDDDKSEYTLAKLLLDTRLLRIVRSEIHTRKEGSFTLELHYAEEENVLPQLVEIFFELDQLRLPFNFLGKDSEIDRKKLRSLDTKSGSILLKFKDYQIQKLPAASG